MSESSLYPVLLLVSRRAKLGHESEFELHMAQFIRAAELFPGCLGAQIVHPGDEPDVDDALYHALMAFDNDASLQAWQHSPERARGLVSIAPYIKGVASVRGISGLANWFQPAPKNKKTQPPRWKIAVVTWMGIPGEQTHFTTPGTAGPLFQDWIKDRLAGKPATNNCAMAEQLPS